MLYVYWAAAVLVGVVSAWTLTETVVELLRGVRREGRPWAKDVIVALALIAGTAFLAFELFGLAQAEG